MLRQVQQQLCENITIPEAERTRFFKTKPGEYAAHDQFLGITVPNVRKIAKKFYHLPVNDIIQLLKSPYNETRLLALFILIHQYQNGTTLQKEAVYRLYCDHTNYINNWNLVDASAHWVVGAHLYKRNRSPLLQFAQSNHLWERRIAIVATWFFIRQGDLFWTFKLAEIFHTDSENLMHKATGWMLREAGKVDPQILCRYLDTHAENMPRTMLRYAIERLTPAQRKHYMGK